MLSVSLIRESCHIIASAREKHTFFFSFQESSLQIAIRLLNEKPHKRNAGSLWSFRSLKSNPGGKTSYHFLGNSRWKSQIGHQSEAPGRQDHQPRAKEDSSILGKIRSHSDYWTLCKEANLLMWLILLFRGWSFWTGFAQPNSMICVFFSCDTFLTVKLWSHPDLTREGKAQGVWQVHC
jgi:hypothetical protein